MFRLSEKVIKHQKRTDRQSVRDMNGISRHGPPFGSDRFLGKLLARLPHHVRRLP